MKDIAQNLLAAAESTADNLDALAPAIIESVLVHQKSQRWVANFLKKNGYKISHVSISRHLKKATENWTSVLDAVTGDVCTANKRAEVRWLASTCLAFRTHKGTFWVRTPPISSVKDLQDQVNGLLDKMVCARAIRIDPTPRGLGIIPLLNIVRDPMPPIEKGQ